MGVICFNRNLMWRYRVYNTFGFVFSRDEKSRILVIIKSKENNVKDKNDVT